MSSIATAMFFLLAAIAAVHLLWAFGVRWPAANERALVALVVGRRGMTKMPSPMQCVAAATAIFVAGVWALMLAGFLVLPLSPVIVTIVGVVMAAVFAGRGVAAYLPAWRERFPQQPFATMDREKYGPLCLLFAVGFVALLITRIGS